MEAAYALHSRSGLRPRLDMVSLRLLSTIASFIERASKTVDDHATVYTNETRGTVTAYVFTPHHEVSLVPGSSRHHGSNGLRTIHFLILIQTRSRWLHFISLSMHSSLFGPRYFVNAISYRGSSYVKSGSAHIERPKQHIIVSLIAMTTHTAVIERPHFNYRLALVPRVRSKETMYDSNLGAITMCRYQH